MEHPLRICLFTPNFLPSLGGAERMGDALARGLIQRGHEVMVLAQTARGTNRGEPQLPYPVRHYRRPLRQHLWPELLAWPLYRTYRRWRFDLVLAFYAYPTGYAATVLQKRCGFKVVVSPRGGDLYPNFHGLEKCRVRNIIAKGYQRADRIVSVSQWISQRLHEVAGNDLPPIDLVPNGIDLEAHDALRDQSRKQPASLPLEGPFVLHLGRIEPVKQHLQALEAVSNLRDVFAQRGISYAIVGDGSNLGAVQEQVRKLHLGAIVKLLGRRTGKEKAWLLDQAMFMVSTSREEGLPNVVLEAMASGLPILASDIGPHRELIENRGWGKLYANDNIANLTQTMRLMLDADLTAYGRQAMQLRTGYTLSAMIDGYEAACRRACT